MGGGGGSYSSFSNLFLRYLFEGVYVKAMHLQNANSVGTPYKLYKKINCTYFHQELITSVHLTSYLQYPWAKEVGY